MKRLTPHFDRSGQGLTEYLILIMLVGVVSIAAVQGLGSTVRAKIDTVRRNINSGIVVDPRR